MTWIRFLVKTFAKPLYRFLSKPNKNPLKTQKILLTKILKLNQNTVFGKTHKFHQISSIRKFQEYLSPQPYEYFRPFINSMTQGKTDVLIPGSPLYWGRTAGSTGASKLIPITNRSIRNATRGTLLIYLSYIAENPQAHSKFLDGTVCFFNANPALEYINNIPVGFGTGIFSQSSQNQIWGPIFQKLTYTTGHLFEIKNIQQRYHHLTRETIQKDIHVFSGVTTVVLGLLEVILKYTQQKNPKIKNIRDLFPNYQFSILGGESPKFYERRLFSLIGEKIDYREVYGATEEIIGVQLQDSPGLTPLFHANFLEFTPLNSTERLLIHEVKKNVDYKIIITNFNGLYAYTLGDVIKFIKTDPPLFEFSHREGTINMASEKMTVQQISTALTLTNQQHDCTVVEYCVVGKYTPKPHYIVILEYLAAQNPTDEKEYLKSFNENLMQSNPVYREQVIGIRAIADPILWIVKNGTFFNLEQQNLEAGLPMGQHKIQHLSTNESLLKKFADYIIKEIKLG
ncbi:MAG: GH3 auxin-responsive promoter family protein [Candidatus Helarchaeota archaeon]|nr:GH3 auxin-responsive promoter family protein [Candidatus Helarchaeota archaeon]